MTLTDKSIVGGSYMERTIYEFVCACEVTILEESQKVVGDTHLIALLCDAVRLTREFAAYRKAVEV